MGQPFTSQPSRDEPSRDEPWIIHLHKEAWQQVTRQQHPATTRHTLTLTRIKLLFYPYTPILLFYLSI